MFTAKIINPNPNACFTAYFQTLESAEKWAFNHKFFIRHGATRVEITNSHGEIVSWY